MKPRLFLGFDYGTHKIGVAIGQELIGSARPLAILHHTADAKTLWAKINQIIVRWKPDGLVVGIPIGFDETNSALCNAARFFCETLRQRYQLPVFEFDELLSTRAAHTQIDEQLHSKKRKHYKAVDDIAAQVILEAWLQENRHSHPLS